MPTFCKEERLCNRKHIFSLFKEGQNVINYPISAKWMEISCETGKNVQFLPTVSKRNFKKAVDRNHIKRIIREAFRLNKEIVVEIAQQQNKKIVIMLVYLGKKNVSFKEIETKFKLILQQIADSL